MTMRTNLDGTIDVRAVLTIRVDPVAWAQCMMGTHPDEVLQKDVRRDVKSFVRTQVQALAGAESAYDSSVGIPIDTVTVEGVY